jgi:exopolysaccharide biosynthesis polyprenyl glycosylphosphotransferase
VQGTDELMGGGVAGLALSEPVGARGRTTHPVGEATRRRAAVIRRSLAVGDVLAATLSLLAITALTDDRVRPLTLVTMSLLVLAAGKLAGLYDRDEVRLRRSTLEEVPQLFQLSGLCALLVWLGNGSVVAGALDRKEVLLLWSLLFVSLCGWRVVTRVAAARAVTAERCLIVGDPSLAAEVADKLAGRHASVVGLVPLRDAQHDLEAIVRRNKAHRIIVVPDQEGDSEALLACVSRAQDMGAAVSILPRVFEVVGSSVEFDHVDGMVLLGVHRFGLSRSSWAIKRAVDIAGAGLLLLFLAPLLAAVALAIRLDSRGPIFFRQLRVGHKGRRFDVLKFRSMYDGADRARAELMALSHAGDGMFKVADDPRVTRVGRLLRRYSLDELPQLINVLRGEMSLVGPRPLVLEEDKRIEGRHRRRLQLTPGMTGPWQVLGTAERRVPLREMVTLDYLYVGNWSLWTDVKILLRTALHVIRGHGL